MGLGFSVFINLKNEKEADRVKAFVKEYYSYLDYIDVNIDHSSKGKSVCVEDLAIGIINYEEVSKVVDSIFTGDFIKAMAGKKFRISSVSILVEMVVIATADFKGDHMEYYAAPDEDEGDITKIIGSEKEGFSTEILDYSEEIYNEVNSRYFEIMAETS